MRLAPGVRGGADEAPFGSMKPAWEGESAESGAGSCPASVAKYLKLRS